MFPYKDKIYMNMKNLNKTDIGLIGLAVMGENQRDGIAQLSSDLPLHIIEQFFHKSLF